MRMENDKSRLQFFWSEDWLALVMLVWGITCFIGVTYVVLTGQYEGPIQLLIYPTSLFIMGGSWAFLWTNVHRRYCDRCGLPMQRLRADPSNGRSKYGCPKCG